MQRKLFGPNRVLRANTSHFRRLGRLHARRQAPSPSSRSVNRYFGKIRRSRPRPNRWSTFRFVRRRDRIGMRTPVKRWLTRIASRSEYGWPGVTFTTPLVCRRMSCTAMVAKSSTNRNSRFSVPFPQSVIGCRALTVRRNPAGEELDRSAGPYTNGGRMRRSRSLGVERAKSHSVKNFDMP